MATGETLNSGDQIDGASEWDLLSEVQFNANPEPDLEAGLNVKEEDQRPDEDLIDLFDDIADVEPEPVDIVNSIEVDDGLNDYEREGVQTLRDWYHEQKHNDPETSEDKLHDEIIAGLGRRLNVPGYTTSDYNDPTMAPSNAQMQRLEYLYNLIVDSAEGV